MITPADAAAWQNASPVALNAAQAEQEMLLRRLIIELGNDPLLADTVVCSGGTTLHHEIANGFIPSGFNLQQAQNAYLSIVNEAEKIHKARKAAAKQQTTPRLCGRTVKSTGLPCRLARHHRGNCRSILPSMGRG